MQPIDIIFSLDNTGSMSPAIAEARRRLLETCDRLFKDIPDLRIGLVTHEDYCDGDDFILKVPLTSDKMRLQGFIETIRAGGGGDAPECYEYVLYDAQKYNWRPEAAKVLVMVGDEIPHEPHYISRRYPRYLPKDRNTLGWMTEADKLVDMGVSIYGVQALGNRDSTSFYEELAKRGNGYKLNLDQLSHITETIVAICYKQTGGEQLQNYQDELQSVGKLNRSIANMIATLSGKEVRTFTSTGHELDAVAPYRFQVLHVDYPVVIKNFVESTGARFQKGKGFYQFTKREEIQPNKEVVLRHKITGDMFSGTKAREMIGLPYGERGNLSPDKKFEYDVFIQSTSNNRKLMAGTEFLYQNE